MSRFLLIILLFLAVFLEGIFSTLPLTLDVLLISYVVKRQSLDESGLFSVFVLAFLLGVVLDIFSLRLLGLSSLFFIIFLFLIILYERKFEVETVPFIMFSSFLGSIFFLIIFGYKYVFLQAIVNSLVTVLLFKIVVNFSLRRVDEQ